MAIRSFGMMGLVLAAASAASVEMPASDGRGERKTPEGKRTPPPKDDWYHPYANPSGRKPSEKFRKLKGSKRLFRP